MNINLFGRINKITEMHFIQRVSQHFSTETTILFDIILHKTFFLMKLDMTLPQGINKGDIVIFDWQQTTQQRNNHQYVRMTWIGITKMFTYRLAFA